MNRLLIPGLCLLLFAALPACKPPPPGGNDGGPDGGPDAGPAFSISVLKSTPTDREPIATSVLSGDRIGVAYYLKVGTDPNNPSNSTFQLRYLEWQNGKGVLLDELIDTVTRVEGVGLAVQPNGQPAVSYLGGNEAAQAYWFQNDAYLAWRSPSGAWTKDIVAKDSSEISNGNSFSSQGFLVGLHSSIAIDSNGNAYYAYRDCHFGQSEQGDFNGSLLDVASGKIGSWTSKLALLGSSSTVVEKVGYGGHNTVLIVNGNPAVVSDQIPAVPDGTGGLNVNFMKRDSSGAWSPLKTVMAVQHTQLGPSFAYDPDPTMGYAVAVMELQTSTLWFASSPDGVTWTTKDPVWQAGSGGWYPSLAIDPAFHEPHIAYYFCDERPGIDETSCRQSDDQLRITHRVGGIWRDELVDPAGGYRPKLSFLSTGKRVVVYSHLTTGALQIAVEN